MSSYFFSLLQMSLLWMYLFANISAVGEMGVGLSLLIVLILLWSCYSFVKYRTLRPRAVKNLFLFLFVLFYIILRILYDGGDFGLIRANILGTTGGVLLFYFAGIVVGTPILDILVLFRNKNRNKKSFFVLLPMLIFLGFVVRLLFDYGGQVRADIFLLEGVSGAYQRPGDFMSIAFIVLSFYYVVSCAIDESKVSSLFRLSVYFLSTALLLICAQLLGSNGATAVILLMGLVSVVCGSVIQSGDLFRRRLQDSRGGKCNLKISVNIFLKLLLLSFLLVVGVVFAVWYFDLDVFSINLFGFGSGQISSLSSRFDILLSSGFSQIAYSPVWGDINVAQIISNDSGSTLHNFMLNIWANFGFMGVVLFAIYFFDSWAGIYHLKRTHVYDVDQFKIKVVALYGLFFAVTIFLYANVAVGYSWSVIWFVMGLLSMPFNLKRRKNFTSLRVVMTDAASVLDKKL